MIYVICPFLIGLAALIGYIWGYRNCSLSFKKYPLIEKAQLIQKPRRMPRYLQRSIPAGASPLKSYFNQPEPHKQAQKTWYGASLN